MGEQGIELDEAAFHEYLAKNGTEKANGYLEAMQDFILQLEEILGGGFSRDGAPTTAHIVRKNIIELLHNKKDFLDCIRKADSKITSTDCLGL